MRVVRDKIYLDKIDIVIECRKLFDTKNVDVNMIFNFIMNPPEHLSLEDVCKVETYNVVFTYNCQLVPQLFKS